MREMQTNGIPKQVELFDDEKRVERINLRNYQIGAIEAIENELKKVRSTALIMATGLGKTVIFASVARKFYNRFSKPVLVLAHRTELLEQATNTLEHFGLKCAVEQGEARTSFLDDHHAIAASVQSLSQIDRLREFPPDYFSLIITDECHHAPTPSYMTIYDHFKTVKHLGVTATPIRSDAVGLKNVFQTVAFQYSIQEGIKEKYLCKIKGKQIKVEGLELEKIKLSKNDFSKAELDEMLMRDKVLQKMVLPTIKYAENRPTIVFTQTVGHAKAITDCFNRIGGKDIAVSVDGGTPELVRRERIEAFKSGEIQFIVNVGVLTEGFDHPPTACIALFRPTRSLGLLAQMVGRGTRLFENKKDCLILDFVGVNNSVKTLNVLDVLDGTILSDREKSAAQKLLDEGLDAETALEKVKLDIAKLEALEVKWKALSSSNAFDLMKLFAVPSCKGLYGGGLATFPQRGLLENAGVKIPASLEKGEASKLIAEIIRRRNAGLATLKQLRYLKRLGCRDFDIETLTFEKAKVLIGLKVQKKSWVTA